jgi:hypothetical protein
MLTGLLTRPSATGDTARRVLAALQESHNTWSRLQTTMVNAFTDGDQVLVEQISWVTSEGGTQQFKPVAFVFTVTDGWVAKISTYRNDHRQASCRSCEAPPSATVTLGHTWGMVHRTTAVTNRPSRTTESPRCAGQTACTRTTR